MKCPKCQFEHEWYYYDHKTKKDILSGDVPALLRVARAAKKATSSSFAVEYDVPGDMLDLHEALKEVEHLLGRMS